MLKLLDQMR